MSAAARRRALATSGLVHPDPSRVSSELFNGSRPFFLAEDKVQVKYEMLRAHVVDGTAVTVAAAAHGYSRAAFYLVAAAFDESGMAGLVDERRGRRGPIKVTPAIAAFITAADPAVSGAEVADSVSARFGVELHRRTVERARRR